MINSLTFYKVSIFVVCVSFSCLFYTKKSDSNSDSKPIPHIPTSFYHPLNNNPRPPSVNKPPAKTPSQSPNYVKPIPHIPTIFYHSPPHNQPNPTTPSPNPQKLPPSALSRTPSSSSSASSISQTPSSSSALSKTFSSDSPNNPMGSSNTYQQKTGENELSSGKNLAPQPLNSPLSSNRDENALNETSHDEKTTEEQILTIIVLT